MIFRSAVFGLLIVFGLVVTASAQHREMSAERVGPSGEAYAAAIRFRGIDAQVAYFDPTRPPPPIETRQPVGRNDDGTPRQTFGLTAGNEIAFVIFFVVLFGFIYLLLPYVGGLPVSFSRQPDDESALSEEKSGFGQEDDPMQVGIRTILNMPDRKRALILLCKNLLTQVVASEGVLVQRSWTDRDTLRRVPQDHAQREVLTALVYDCERVQFGGRNVSEDEFRSYLTRVQPLVSKAVS